MKQNYCKYCKRKLIKVGNFHRCKYCDTFCYKCGNIVKKEAGFCIYCLESFEVRKLSWFQKVILFYISFLMLASNIHQDIIKGVSSGGIFGMLGSFLAYVAFFYLIMYLYNRFIHPKINVKSKNLLLSWQIIRYIITSLIVLWFLIAVFGLIFIK